MSCREHQGKRWSRYGSANVPFALYLRFCGVKLTVSAHTFYLTELTRWGQQVFILVLGSVWKFGAKTFEKLWNIAFRSHHFMIGVAFEAAISKRRSALLNGGILGK
jgi:hypothetical protein